MNDEHEDSTDAERDSVAEDDELDADEVPTLPDVPLAVFQGEALATLRQITLAREAVARMMDASTGVRSSRAHANTPEERGAITAACENLEALFGGLPSLTPEQRARLQEQDPETKERARQFYEFIVEDPSGEVAQMAEDPAMAECYASLMAFRDAHERAILADRVCAQMRLLIEELESVRALDQNRLLGALFQSKGGAGVA